MGRMTKKPSKQEPIKGMPIFKIDSSAFWGENSEMCFCSFFLGRNIFVPFFWGDLFLEKTFLYLK